MSHKSVASNGNSFNVEALAAKLPLRPTLGIAGRLQPKPTSISAANAHSFNVAVPQVVSINTPKKPLAPIPSTQSSLNVSNITTVMSFKEEVDEISPFEGGRPVGANTKTVLPAIATQKSFITTQSVPSEMEMPANVNELNKSGPLAIAAFVRDNAQQFGFLYLAELPWYERTAGIYSVKIVPHSATKPDNYYTISAGGVTHVLNTVVEFTPLNQWLREFRVISKLLAKKTFKNFRLWKEFAVWRKNVIGTNKLARIERLQARLFVLDVNFRSTLCLIRSECLGLVAGNSSDGGPLTMCNIDKTRTYLLPEFLLMQHASLKAVFDKLGGFRESVRDLVLKVCKSVLAQAGFSETADAMPVVDARSVPGDHKASYTAQANKRAVCLRLTQFIRLIDVLVSDSMHALAVDSIHYLHDHLASLNLYEASKDTAEEYAHKLGNNARDIGRISFAADPLRHSVVEVDGTLVAIRRPTLAGKKVDGRALLAVKGNAIKEEVLSPLFKVQMLISLEMGITGTPDLNNHCDSIKQLLVSFQKAVVGIETLLPDKNFSPYTTPVISGRTETACFSESTDLNAVFEADVGLKALDRNISILIGRAFSAVNAVKNTLNDYHTMLLRNDAFTEEWLVSNEHSPEFFRESLARYKQEYTNCCSLAVCLEAGMLVMDLSQFRDSVLPSPLRCLELIQKLIPKRAAAGTKNAVKLMNAADISMKSEPSTTIEFVSLLNFTAKIDDTLGKIELEVKNVSELYDLIEQFQVESNPEDLVEYSQIKTQIMNIRDTAKKVQDDLPKRIEQFAEKLEEDISQLSLDVLEVRNKSLVPMVMDASQAVPVVLAYMEDLNESMNKLQEKAAQFKTYQKAYKIEQTKFSVLEDTHVDIRSKKTMWTCAQEWSDVTVGWNTVPFSKLDADEVTQVVTKIFKQVFTLSKQLPANDVVPAMMDRINKLKAKLPTIQDMRNPSLKKRHWDRINTTIGQELVQDETLTLELLDSFGIWAHTEALAEISSSASSEAALEIMLNKILDAWKITEFPVLSYKDSKDVFILGGTDDIQVLLDDSQVNIGTISGSRYVGPIKNAVDDIQRQLNLFSDTLEEWMNCQRSWLYLESIFSAPDIQRQLPNEAKLFQEVDKSFKDAMRRTNQFPNALRAGCTPGFLEMFKRNNSLLDEINRCLEAYLEKKRVAFARFYFLSNDELLEILSQTKDPMAVQPHMRKCFDAIQKLNFGGSGQNPDILGMYSPEGELVPFNVHQKGLKVRGNVEVWLGTVEAAMVKCLRAYHKSSIADFLVRPRHEWVREHCSQVIISVSQIFWAKGVEEVLRKENPTAGLVAFEKKSQADLAQLASIAREKIASLFRKVLGALITIDVHARDIIGEMLVAGVQSVEDFEWNKQLRYVWDDSVGTDGDVVALMSNSRYVYAHEYMGASPRLVITPLTDRCYLCLMGALQLDLGGAPAGPAGTGKTETTKDLAKALGTQCVVFNCSEGLDFRMMGRFFAGLAQSGAWCCFDEFNRIDIEVLSVIAQQILTIRNAKCAKLNNFMFEGREIKLLQTCAVFITMNPGYAGRTELPDNLKALFRPFAMMVPDYGLIAEVILFSEGFEGPKSLARKMVQMYKLCSEQLSQQDHYDFGMRAVKSVLVMAGQLKRERSDQEEALVLLTALRDSNLPKFLADDAILFEAILSDLFPGMVLPEHDYGKLQAAIQTALAVKKLEILPKQVKKVIQFYETMCVRWGVMLVGPTGGGKTVVYNALADALSILHKDGVKHPDYQPVQTVILNPKAITMGELYGEVNKASLEWKDGLMAMSVRSAAAQANDDHKWIISDGPVDALWIENMNTVLDDNKMLCLANSERIKLSPSMHMLFEVQDLRVASPATVSRCGMVYVDPTELGWRPSMIRWQKALPKLSQVLKDYILQFFDSHVNDILYKTRKNMTQAMLQTDESKIASCCDILQELLTGVDAKYDWLKGDEDFLKKIVANLFTFSLIWSVGGNLIDKDLEKFDALVRDSFNEVREVKIPGAGTVFDYYFKGDDDKPAFVGWETIVPAFQYDVTIPFFDMLVPTTATVKFSYLLEKLTLADRSVLFTGGTGVGKSVIARDCLQKMQQNRGFIPVTINFSAQTSSARTQEMIESKLDKKRKTILGAPEGKRIIVFVDDLNMPRLDTYGAQPPIELLRQYQDFRGFYDREKLFWKDIRGVTLSAGCAPPGGGRNNVSPRFIRHFAMFSIPSADERSLRSIFTQIMDGFTLKCEFSKSVQRCGPSVVNASVEIYLRMMTELLPTPAKSHYVFNLRDLSKCMQGVLQADNQNIKEGDQLWELFCHESMRVFHDRLVTAEDKVFYCGVLAEMSSKHFGKQIDADTLGFKPELFGDFMKVGAQKSDRIYEKIDMTRVATVLNTYLDDYNVSSSKEMNLVFFMDAIQHIARISRMIRQPRGNALLVGVGGCGKQSLTRMACHMAGYKCFQIEITRGYGSTEFREDLKKLYESAGTQGKDTVFLFTDTQIVVEDFLEDINNILNSGEVPNLIEADELEKFVGPCRPLAKAAGYPETRDGVYQYFIGRVRDKLHLVLCMSPVGDSFRSRCRMFPSIVNCCTIDWFTEWPKEALLSVAKRFFEFVDLGNEDLKPRISEMCVEIHTSVSAMATRFYSELRRRYYTTPTSYLELINLYSSMLDEKRKELVLSRDRFKSGLSKLLETNELVGSMQITLGELTPVLKQKSADTALLMERLRVDQADADRVRRVVKEEEALAKASAKETDAIRQDAQKDLDSALPALAAATKALESLDKKDIQELKVFNTPPKLVELVLNAVCVLFDKKPEWKSSKLLLGENDFLKQLVLFDKDNIPEKILKKLKVYIDDPQFQPELVKASSTPCMSICLWVRAVDLYAHVFKEVEPKRNRLNEAEASLAKTMAALKEKQDQLKAVEDKIAVLKKGFDDSVKAKEDLETNMAVTAARLGRAAQLQSALGDEQVRWAETVLVYDVQVDNVVGNVFIAAACVAYFGAFTASYRNELVSSWISKCVALDIPVTENLSISSVLTTPFQIRQWNTFGLPRDTLSTDNAILVSCGRRWPLMIDPQDQANGWIRQMEAKNKLQVVKLTEPNFLRTLENCIRTGAPCLLEEVYETLDPALEPILLKQTFKQGGRLLIRLGDSDVDYDKNFKFYMTTKMSNPHYLPEICIKVTIINFTVTKSGLEDQLLADVVRLERPDLEQQRTKLIVAINEDKASLKAIEDKILKLLFTSKGVILDNEVLIATLGESKVTSGIINNRLGEAEKTEASISEAREKYRPAAIRGSVIFFVIADMPLVDPMYQYSLGYFKQLFVDCINKSEASTNLDVRLTNISDFATLTIYTSVARGLFEKHKLVFSFMLCAEILRQRKDISNEEWSFFLRGGVGLASAQPRTKPELSWLSNDTWSAYNLVERALPDVFSGVSVDLGTAPMSFSIGDKVCTPNPASWPGSENATAVDWNAKLTDFQKLILTKQTAEEEVVQMISAFVSAQIGQAFTESPIVDLNTLYKDMKPTVPLIFILSVGSDPMTSFLRFAKDMGYLDRQNSVSLGQGQGPVAEKLISIASKNGDWVFLQNCHLARSWMLSMEQVIKGLGSGATVVHDDFRLFLSSAPADFFPVSVLQNSVKVTNEPPKGIRANLRRAFTSISQDSFESHFMGVKWRKLVFGLCFFHGIVQERTKYGPLGWNIPYEFSNSDRECALLNLELFLREGKVPWKALAFITREVTYGGRVTDSWDQRCLRAVLQKYFNPQSIDDGYKYSPSGLYYAPDTKSLKDYVDYIEALPMNDNPEIFGMHDNANVVFLRKESTVLRNAVLEVQPRLVASGGQRTPDEIVFDTADTILAILPKVLLDIDLDTGGKFTPDANGRVPSLSTVLKQETDRFNNLMKALWKSLDDIKRAIRGFLVMSNELEKVYNSFINNQVPEAWAKAAYPSLKPLASWVKDLALRIEAVSLWIIKGQPTSFWLSGFFFPQGFLTGVLQTYARKYNQPIDALTFRYVFLDVYYHQSVVEKPELPVITDGVLTHGLFMDAFRWDDDLKCVADSRPGEMQAHLPVMHMVPIVNAAPVKNTYKSPLYKTSVRAGVLSTTGHSTNFVVPVDLPSTMPEDYWIAKGAALLCQLDV